MANGELCVDDGSMVGLFFSDVNADINRAKAICSRCPYMEPCFQGARQRREPWGVWGGQLFHEGRVIAAKPLRGRPPKRPLEMMPCG